MIPQAGFSQSPPKCPGWLLFILTCLALVLHLWGIRRDLPYIYEIDEPFFVTPAVNMAATGNLNPGWFGNPGSTVIYPMAAGFRIWRGVVDDVPLLRPNPGLRQTFERNFANFYLLGRYLSTAYAVLSLPLIYLLGKRAFNEWTGLAAGFLFAFYPLAVSHAQYVRTDSAAAFFGLLSLYLCLRAYDQPTLWNHALAGAAIGLSVSSRYFMVVLIPFLLLLDLHLLWRRPANTQSRQMLNAALTGAAVTFVAFAATTPYFFLDLDTARAGILQEARSEHLGADGLSRPGNFLWYLSQAIPEAISWPQVALVIFGVTLAWREKQNKQIALLGFVMLFLAGISLSRLHWARWTIQILPLLALFAASAMIWVSDHVTASLGLNPRWFLGLVILGAFIAAAQPGYRLILMNIRQSNPSTRLLARQWIIENIPQQSKIAFEWYTAPLSGTDFQSTEWPSLAYDRELGDYLNEGYEYLVVSSAMYARFFSEPERYEHEVSFYKALFEGGELLKRFKPTKTRGGPLIQIYRLQPSQ